MWYHSPLQSYAFLDTFPATYTHTHNYFNTFHVPWRGLSADYRKLHFAHEPTAYTGSKLRGLITDKYPMTEEGSLPCIFKLTLIPQVWASEIKHGLSFPWFLHRTFVCVQPNSWRFEKMEEKHQNVINNLIWLFFIFILSNISLELGSSLLLNCSTLSLLSMNCFLLPPLLSFIVEFLFLSCPEKFHDLPSVSSTHKFSLQRVQGGRKYSNRNQGHA